MLSSSRPRRAPAEGDQDLVTVVDEVGLDPHAQVLGRLVQHLHHALRRRHVRAAEQVDERRQRAGVLGPVPGALGVRHPVAPGQLVDALVDGHGQAVALLRGQVGGAVEEGLHLLGAGHAAEREVPQPQLVDAHAGPLQRDLDERALPLRRRPDVRHRRPCRS